MTVTAETVAAWLRASIADDSEALRVIADTSDHLDLLEEVTGGCLALLSSAIGLDAVDQALADWQQRQIEEATP